jgi:hypothetical protein
VLVSDPQAGGGELGDRIGWCGWPQPDLHVAVGRDDRVARAEQIVEIHEHSLATQPR